MKIIYPYEGSVAIIDPSPEWDIEDVAKKDVPAGLPYLILEDADIPVDQSSRSLWVADFSEPHGHGIGADAWFALSNVPEIEA